jgi:hypothetical protein
VEAVIFGRILSEDEIHTSTGANDGLGKEGDRRSDIVDATDAAAWGRGVDRGIPPLAEVSEDNE